MPKPKRRSNPYRNYTEADVERVRLVAGARSLDLSRDDIREILALCDRREAPCRMLRGQQECKAAKIKQRIAQLQRLEKGLRQLRGG